MTYKLGRCVRRRGWYPALFTKCGAAFYIATDGMQYENGQQTGVYISRYYARKAANGADVVVKVDGGYKIMTAANYRVWKKQK